MARYTPEELDHCALLDLLADAKSAEAQAANGPFYPDRDITAESLLRYAANCRADAAKYQNGGAHRAVITGR